MSSPHLLRPFPSRQLGLIEGDHRVVVFGVLGGRRVGPTVLVHGPTLLLRLEHLGEDVELVVFVEGSPPNAATIATVDDMLAAMGPEDGLVQYQVATEAIKMIQREMKGGRAPGPPPLKGGRAPGPPPLITRGVDRSTVVSFRPPEILRSAALAAAVVIPPSELWVNPAGLVVASGGRVETYPRTSSLG